MYVLGSREVLSCSRDMAKDLIAMPKGKGRVRDVRTCTSV